jgi:2-C-methyl-D-erythritol 2,4-cyclodiphosphate synthase
VAHSDGDVAIHALCDALLGAVALGDIGKHFPDNDMTYKGIDSTILLSRTIELLKTEGYKVGNVDITIALERPKLRPHIDQMRARLAEVMGVEIGAVSVKATTTEKLGFTGRGEGVAAYAVALVVPAV